jgi:hypothetical protein
MSSKDDWIFSGDKSKKFWKLINRLTKKKSRKKRKRLAWRVMIALYAMGCKCQELEALVRKQRGKDDPDAVRSG